LILIGETHWLNKVEKIPWKTTIYIIIIFRGSNLGNKNLLILETIIYGKWSRKSLVLPLFLMFFRGFEFKLLEKTPFNGNVAAERHQVRQALCLPVPEVPQLGADYAPLKVFSFSVR